MGTPSTPLHRHPCQDWRMMTLRSIRKGNRMKQTMLRFLAGLMLVGIAPQPAYAWNDYGHMSVAYVAYKKLTPQTRNKVNALLAKNPDFPNWVAVIPARNLPCGQKPHALYDRSDMGGPHQGCFRLLGGQSRQPKSVQRGVFAEHGLHRHAPAPLLALHRCGVLSRRNDITSGYPICSGRC